ncbi:MAG: hypothetical protein WA116_10260 [Anaerolineaceae bacterium]
MDTSLSGKVLKIITTVTFIAMVVVNALANILPINGVNTGDISNSYPNLFAPTALTFTIWGLIYLLLALHTLYQLGFLQHKEPVNEALLRKVDILFSISSLANTAWIFMWHYRLIPLSMLMMIVILLCLILINNSIRNEDLSSREKFFIKLPFSIYFGWITIATIANAVTLLVALEWNGFGISEPIWTILILLIGTLIGGFTTFKNRNVAYGLVLVWAYIGILIKHVSPDGFGGEYLAVIVAVSVCLVCLVAVIGYVIFGKKKTSAFTN